MRRAEVPWTLNRSYYGTPSEALQHLPDGLSINVADLVEDGRKSAAEHEVPPSLPAQLTNICMQPYQALTDVAFLLLNTQCCWSREMCCVKALRSFDLASTSS